MGRKTEVGRGWMWVGCGSPTRANSRGLAHFTSLSSRLDHHHLPNTESPSHMPHPSVDTLLRITCDGYTNAPLKTFASANTKAHREASQEGTYTTHGTAQERA